MEHKAHRVHVDGISPGHLLTLTKIEGGGRKYGAALLLFATAPTLITAFTARGINTTAFSAM